jgi:hypothetical protein
VHLLAQEVAELCIRGHLLTPLGPGPGLGLLDQEAGHAPSPEGGEHVKPLEVAHGGGLAPLGVGAEGNLHQAQQKALFLGHEGRLPGVLEEGLHLLGVPPALRPERLAQGQVGGKVLGSEGAPFPRPGLRLGLLGQRLCLGEVPFGQKPEVRLPHLAVAVQVSFELLPLLAPVLGQGQEVTEGPATGQGLAQGLTLLVVENHLGGEPGGEGLLGARRRRKASWSLRGLEKAMSRRRRPLSGS